MEERDYSKPLSKLEGEINKIITEIYNDGYDAAIADGDKAIPTNEDEFIKTHPIEYISYIDDILALIHKACNKSKLEEIEALYARADKDPELRDRLDKLYILRYENLGGGNIFILDRLKTLRKET